MWERVPTAVCVCVQLTTGCLRLQSTHTHTYTLVLDVGSQVALELVQPSAGTNDSLVVQLVSVVVFVVVVVLAVAAVISVAVVVVLLLQLSLLMSLCSSALNCRSRLWGVAGELNFVPRESVACHTDTETEAATDTVYQASLLLLLLLLSLLAVVVAGRLWRWQLLPN